MKAEQRDQEAQDMIELLERMQFEDERVSGELSPAPHPSVCVPQRQGGRTVFK